VEERRSPNPLPDEEELRLKLLDRMPPEEAKLLTLRMRRAGYKLQEIADATGRKKSQVGYWCRKAGLSRGKPAPVQRGESPTMVRKRLYQSLRTLSLDGVPPTQEEIGKETLRTMARALAEFNRLLLAGAVSAKDLIKYLETAPKAAALMLGEPTDIVDQRVRDESGGSDATDIIMEGLAAQGWEVSLRQKGAPEVEAEIVEEEEPRALPPHDED